MQEDAGTDESKRGSLSGNERKQNYIVCHKINFVLVLSQLTNELSLYRLNQNPFDEMRY